MKLLLLLMAEAAFCSSPVGVVVSAGPISLSGTLTNADGVIQWTLLDNDEIQTKPSPALLWVGGARATVSGDSRVKVKRNSLQVIEGEAFVTCPERCQITVFWNGGSETISRGNVIHLVNRNNNVSVSRRAPVPAFDVPPEFLTRRLPYTLGVYLPSNAR